MNARVARITVCTPGPYHRVHAGPVSPCASRSKHPNLKDPCLSQQRAKRSKKDETPSSLARFHELNSSGPQIDPLT